MGWRVMLSSKLTVVPLFSHLSLCVFSWHLSLHPPATYTSLPSQMMATLQMVHRTHVYVMLICFLTLWSSLYPIAWLWSCSHFMCPVMTFYSFSPRLHLLPWLFWFILLVALFWFLSPFLVPLSAGLFCIHRVGTQAPFWCRSKPC